MENAEWRFRPDSRDKELMSRCNYRSVSGSLRGGIGSAKRQIIFRTICEDGIDCRQVKNNTYAITKNDKEYIVVFCSYGSRKTKSGYTVGKEVADKIVLEREKNENWYGLFAKFDDNLEITEDIYVVENTDFEPTRRMRSNKKGFYHDYPLSSLENNTKKMSLREWYESLE